MSNCEQLERMANERDAAYRAAALAKLPERMRAEAFIKSPEGYIFFNGDAVGRWLADGMQRRPYEHPCWATLARFQRRQLDDETLAMIRVEFDKIIEWCMTKPDVMRRRFAWLPWRRSS